MIPLLAAFLIGDGTSSTIPLPPPSAPQEQHQSCAPWASVKSQLADKYHEKPIWTGLIDPQHAFVLFAADGGLTWTLILRDADGVACLIGAGESGEDLPRGDGI